MHLLVIGGSDAGIEAARRARELDPSVEVTLVVADAYPNFSICGLPYYLSGDVADWRSLAHRTTADLEAAGLRLLLDHTAQAIDPARKQITATGPDGADHRLGYDRLVVATGDRASGRLLGAQLVGDHRGEVAKRIDIPAGALFHGMTVDGLNDLDLSYTPPFGSPWDAVQLAAQAWVNQAGRS
jgi:hypothetical protein